LQKLVFPVFFFLVFPGAVVYAGFFSFLNGIGDFMKVNTQEKSLNSQNVVLLAAVAGPEVASHVAAAEVSTVGGSALLADAGPSGGMANVSKDEYDNGQISIYVIREGDTFLSIATMFNVSVNTILWANDLPRGSKLQIGQTLIILPVSGVQYVVKKGDTIAGITKKYKGDIDEVRSYNGIDEGDTLEVGSTVIIPDGEVSTATVTYRPATSKLRGSSGPTYDGYYRAPLANYRKSQGLHGWNGVDLVSYDGVGAAVGAAAGGQVFFVKRGCTPGYRSCGGGYGNYVVINHSNGTQTLYGHLRSVAVSAGDVVAAGQVIGTEGNTGRSTGAHLHFEIHGARNPF
jgi:LysM repeat protein